MSAFLRGGVTVWRRRGLGYFGYLCRGVLWPTFLYRFGWGPDAPSLARFGFSVVGRLSSSVPSDDWLRRRAVLADQPFPPPSTVDLDAAEALMDRAHAAGVTGTRHALDHLVRVNGSDARFTAMPRARVHRRRGACYLAERDEDRQRFNERFGAALLTEATARQELRALKAAVPIGYRDYAPIDFGGGLRVGRIASTDSGTGRWDFFNGRVVGPLVAGKRVLDLGCNNGSLPLMMLRAGAREIVAIEQSGEIADFARLNARILSWRDVCAYRFHVLTGDMRMFLTRDLGPFDVVTAFCSLYYLPEIDMARIIRKAAEMSATLVLQANDAIANLPAPLERLRSLMAGNGYAQIDVFAPAGFARPLLVGEPRALSVPMKRRTSAASGGTFPSVSSLV